MRRALLIASLLSTLACKGSDPDPQVAAAEPEVEHEASPLPVADPDPAREPVPTASDRAAKLAEGLDRAAYEADLRFIAAVRPPGSAHWQAVQDRCAETLEASGFTVSRVTGDGAGTSVVGRKQGSDAKLPAIVVGAHYDHVEDCPGADDNASGTAAALALARTLGSHEWSHTLYVACWDEEETGLNGSEHWANQTVAEGQAIALYLNFDAIGYADDTPNSQTLPPGAELLFAEQIKYLKAREFRGDFIGVLADDGAREPCQRYLAHAARLGLPAVLLEIPGVLKNDALLSELRRSDHASFWKHDIPALFLSDTANYRTDTYHCMKRPDTVETLDLEFALQVTQAAVATVAELL
ncbi:MAG TPA: M28 family peptidase [Enhygromyxa sp.]|nr:M28 family peptidase [Enhygromyxa sp.]